MKKVKLFSILFVCFFALVLVSCEDSVTGGTNASGPEAALNGTWIYTEFDGWESLESVIIFNNGNWENHINRTPLYRGTITIPTSNHIIVNVTQIQVLGGWTVWDIWDGNHWLNIHLPLPPRWYSRSELITAVSNGARAAGVPESRISDEIRGIEEEFAPVAGTFILSANHLSLTLWGETTTYTRRN